MIQETRENARIGVEMLEQCVICAFYDAKVLNQLMGPSDVGKATGIFSQGVRPDKDKGVPSIWGDATPYGFLRKLHGERRAHRG